MHIDSSKVTACISELAAAVEALLRYKNDLNDAFEDTSGEHQIYDRGSVSMNGTAQDQDRNSIGTVHDVHHARRQVLTVTARLQVLLAEPEDFLRRLASQSQILASLRWLGEHQVSAYIPLSGNVLISEIAELAGVAESQLSRIVRMTATAGFLQEVQPGYISHTPLSAAFVNNLTFFDAVMCLAKTVAPAALQMGSSIQDSPTLSKDFKLCSRLTANGHILASDPTGSLGLVSTQNSKFQREWSAYLKFTEDDKASLSELLSQLEWDGSKASHVVCAGASSFRLAHSVSELHPGTRVIVQVTEASREYHLACQNSLVNKQNGSPQQTDVQIRSVGTPQAEEDASLYIIELPPPSHDNLIILQSSSKSAKLSGCQSCILAEIRAHIRPLRKGSLVIFIVPSWLLPDPGSVEVQVEIVARTRDLSRLQLTNDHEPEIGELVNWIHSIRDGSSGLLVVKTMTLRSTSTIALAVRYQSHLGRGTGADLLMRDLNSAL